MRALLDEAAPWVALVSETNVPHADNISYFGDGANEAQMVYNFSLPPLVLHSIIRQDATKLSRWAETLETPSDRTAFFNFLASHDGIGVTPVLGILDEDEVRAMVEHVQAQGGKVSFKSNPDGSKSPYELNINYLDALAGGQTPSEPPELQARRFLTSQAIMLALKGVPGCYFHSLAGSRGWLDGVEKQGHARAINREKLDDQSLRGELEKNRTLRSHVYGGFRAMLQKRRRNPAFHPQGKQTILRLDQRVFALVREALKGNQRVLCLHNVSSISTILEINLAACDLNRSSSVEDLLGKTGFEIQDDFLRVSLDAFGSAWLAFHTDGTAADSP
jgi:sucrose phosphorylase